MVFSAAGVILLLAGVANAQNPASEFTIWGRVSLPEGHFSRQSGIEVRLERPGRLALYSISTDEDGRFQFRNLEGGEYFVYINLEGYTPLLQQVFLRRPAQTDATVTLVLRRGPGDSTLDGTRKDSHTPSEGGTGKAVVIDAATLRKYPQKVIREFEEARKEADSGKPEKAAERLKKMLTSAPDFYDAHLELGLALQRTNRLKEAEAAFGRAREINPKAAQPLINLAGVHLDRARVEQAPALYQTVVTLMDEAIDLDPEQSEAYYFLGSALFKLEQLEPAEDALRRSLLFQRRNEEARLMLVNVYIKQRRLRDALDQLDLYLEANPTSPQRPAVEQLRDQIRKSLGV
jgi:Tfp pilus assembly protein PilF